MTAHRSSVGICLYECDPVSTGANLDELKAEDKFRVYDCMYDNKSDLNLTFCHSSR